MQAAGALPQSCGLDAATLAALTGMLLPPGALGNGVQPQQAGRDTMAVCPATLHMSLLLPQWLWRRGAACLRANDVQSWMAQQLGGSIPMFITRQDDCLDFEQNDKYRILHD